MPWIEPVTLTGAHVVLEPVADRMRNAPSVRRAKRVGRSLRDRWDRR